MIDDAIDQLVPIAGTNAALAVVGEDRASWYRRHRHSPQPVRPERIDLAPADWSTWYVPLILD
jgi:hypothetical protein